MVHKDYSFTAQIEPAEEGGFVVTVPAINGHTQAESFQEAIDRAQELVEFYVSSSIQSGDPIVAEPVPTNAISLRVSVPQLHE